MSCVFCDGPIKGPLVRNWQDVVAFLPLRPVTPGHVLIVPRRHVSDAREDPALTGRVMECASEYVRDECHAANILTSCGSAATQTVFHLHLHVLPRKRNDGVRLPWTMAPMEED